MVRADLIASAREKDGCNNGRDVYDLDNVNNVSLRIRQ